MFKALSRKLYLYSALQGSRTICFDPTEGGAVKLKGNILPPAAGLPMGYLFNIIVGGLLTYCGFDTLASKIASFVRAVFTGSARVRLIATPADGRASVARTLFSRQWNHKGDDRACSGAHGEHALQRRCQATADFG